MVNKAFQYLLPRGVWRYIHLTLTQTVTWP